MDTELADSAIELLNEAGTLDGDDSGNARVEPTEIHFDRGREEEARAQRTVLVWFDD